MIRFFALFLSFFLLQSVSFAKEKVKVEVLAKSTKSWNGNVLPPYPSGQPQIMILKITIPPHYKLPMHEHPVINAGVMLSGELTVITQSGKVLHLKKGDSIIEVVDTWHYGINETDKPAIIIVFYAGTKDQKITILKSTKK